MSRAALIRKLGTIRRLKEDRAAIALARGNARKAETEALASAENAVFHQMRDDLHPRLTEHLRAASAMNGAASRYTAYVLAATTDRAALARQRDIAQTAQRTADMAFRAAEAFRNLHAMALRRREALDEVAKTLTHAEDLNASLREEDLQSDQRPVPPTEGARP
jgi:hypothetical protein